VIHGSTGVKQTPRSRYRSLHLSIASPGAEKMPNCQIHMYVLNDAFEMLQGAHPDPMIHMHTAHNVRDEFGTASDIKSRRTVNQFWEQ